MAEQFADESRVEAQLASAKTADVKAKAVNDETTRSTGTLIEELQRKSGDLIEQMQRKAGEKP
jgi:hypothetical protein